MKIEKTVSSALSNSVTTLLLGLSVGGLTGSVMADGGHGSGDYVLSSLVSDQTGVARYIDSNLVNPWGILAGPEGHLIVVDNHAGVTTTYDSHGRPNSLTINIPAPDGSPGGAVTDLAMNRSKRSFMLSSSLHSDGSVLLFATEDGTISGWNPAVDPHNAVIAVDNSKAGAIYKSMALGSTTSGPMLYAANFGQGMVEIFDGGFHLVRSFTDPDLASASYAPFAVRVLRGHLFVTFAFKSLPTDGDETAGPGLGYVDEFDLAGNFVRRFASQGTLNAPWGMAMAPLRFGKFGGALLVGNFGDGAINAYDPRTGAFLGQVSDPKGQLIRIEGLWGLAFGSEGRSLYFTAGPNDENNGLLGVLRAENGGHGMGN